MGSINSIEIENGQTSANTLDVILKRLDKMPTENVSRKDYRESTMALLKNAQKLLDKAEETIAAQENRIKKLEEVATTDDLTGLKNRRGFFHDFMAEIDRCDRDLSDGGLLLLIDIDNFKAINSTHGHVAGDASLRIMGKKLSEHIRVMDTAARLSGDEFVLLFSGTTKEKTAQRAQNLILELNTLFLPWYGEKISLRASIGLQSYTKGDVPDHIFNAADRALYLAKQGKNAPQKDNKETGTVIATT